MSTADRLTHQFANSMLESMGLRNAEALPDLPQKVIAMADPNLGRRPNRDASHIELERLIPDPAQPRKTFTEENLQGLAASLVQHGQLQPALVRWSDEQKIFVIISGERRWRAAQLAGLQTLSCVVVEREFTETDLRQWQLVENLQREDLKPVETAKSYQELMTLNQWSAQQLAEALKIGKGTVSKALALLELPEDLQQQVDAGTLSASTAYEVAKLQDAQSQRELASRIVTEGLKRDDVVATVSESTGKKPRKADESAEGKAKPSVTKREYQAGTAKIVISWNKKTVRTKDVIAALESVLAEIRRETQPTIIEETKAA